MSAAGIDWEQLPDVVEAFIHLDAARPADSCRSSRPAAPLPGTWGRRTHHSRLSSSYRTGTARTAFYPRPTSPRVHVRRCAQALALIDELPTRRCSATAQTGLRLQAWPHESRFSDRTVYRFLADHGLSQHVRYRCWSKTRAAPTAPSRRLTLWLWSRPTPATASGSTPPGRKKTYLFLWTRFVPHPVAKYYFDEKLPAMLTASEPDALWHPQLRVYVDGGKVYVASSPFWSNCTDVRQLPYRLRAQWRSRTLS